jgi:hypothetical protein
VRHTRRRAISGRSLAANSSAEMSTVAGGTTLPASGSSVTVRKNSAGIRESLLFMHTLVRSLFPS